MRLVAELDAAEMERFRADPAALLARVGDVEVRDAGGMLGEEYRWCGVMPVGGGVAQDLGLPGDGPAVCLYLRPKE